MNQSKPRLMDTGTDGETRKPEEIEGQDIVILKSMTTRMPDGREACKWAVKLADGSTGIFWSAGQDPTLKVSVWFMEQPTTPLPCRIFRQPNKYGTHVWHIIQRDLDDDGQEVNAAVQGTLDQQLSQVGL